MTSATKTKLLAAGAIFGVIVTSVLCIKAGSELESVTEMYTTEKNFSDRSKVDLAKEYIPKIAKTLAPSAISGAATIGAIAILCRKSVKTEGALSASLMLATTQLETLRTIVPEEVEKVYISTNEEKYKDVIPTSKCEILVEEPYTGQIIATSAKTLDKAVARANKRIQNNYILRLNRFIRDIGGDEMVFADYIGWAFDSNAQQKYWEEAECLYFAIRLKRSYQDSYGRTIHPIEYKIDPVDLFS